MPADWRERMGAEASDERLEELEAFVVGAEQLGRVFPGPEEVFASLHLTPYASVRVVILGQDPYLREGQATGLAFSVADGCALSPSLKNILLELQTDLECAEPANGSLVQWAQRGVLMLNEALTVREGAPGSHAAKWRRFTDAVISAIARRHEPVVFLLWGRRAQGKAHLVKIPPHVVLCSPHPSPRSAWRGFLGSKPFSSANKALAARGLSPIDWRLA